MAVEACDEATHRQWKVGAVIVRGGSVLSIGTNKYRNDPALVDYEKVSYHAEEVAIRRAGNVEGATIYVARLTRSGKIGSARPCRRCQGLLLENRVSTAVWTESYGWDKQRLSRLSSEQIPRTKAMAIHPEVHPLLRR